MKLDDLTWLELFDDEGMLWSDIHSVELGIIMCIKY